MRSDRRRARARVVAMLGLEDDRETETVEVFCPDCAAREFEREPRQNRADG